MDYGGTYYTPGLPSRAVDIKEIEPGTVQIRVLEVSTWEPFEYTIVSSEIASPVSVENYVKEKYLIDFSE